MITRIRYVQKNKEEIISKVYIMVNNRFCSVVINPSRCTYKVVSLDNEVLLEGTSTSLPNTKMTVKRKLRKMGVQFTDEIRQRGNTTILGLENNED